MSDLSFSKFVEVLDVYTFHHHEAVELTGIGPKDLQNAANRGLLGEFRGDLGRGSRREYTGRQLVEIALVNQLLRLKVPIGEAIKVSVGTLTEHYINKLKAISSDPSVQSLREFVREIAQIHGADDGSLYVTIIGADHTSVDSLRGETARIVLPAGWIIMGMANRYGDRRKADEADL